MENELFTDIQNLRDEDESEEELENLCGACMCLGSCKGSGTGSCPPED